jgi:hypothetical protein
MSTGDRYVLQCDQLTFALRAQVEVSVDFCTSLGSIFSLAVSPLGGNLSEVFQLEWDVPGQQAFDYLYFT